MTPLRAAIGILQLNIVSARVLRGRTGDHRRPLVGAAVLRPQAAAAGLYLKRESGRWRGLITSEPVREWRGVTHTVLIHADGIEWRGQRYRSLSVVAREITGARWSGPRFFGLRRRQLDSARAGDGEG